MTPVEGGEWGVTLFAGEPLTFKKIVTDMRFDEVSAQYAEFGEFFVGKVREPAKCASTVARNNSSQRTKCSRPTGRSACGGNGAPVYPGMPRIRAFQNAYILGR